MLQILVATFAQFSTFRLVIGYEYTEYGSPVGPELQPRADNTESDNFNCTTPGRFSNPADCSQYYLCTRLSLSEIYLSYMTCPNELVFNPESQYCTSPDNYECPPTDTTTTTTTATTTPSPRVCTGPGFFCNSDTTFTLCADVDLPILIDYACEPGYFCNEKCANPCTDSLPLC
jgi:hypothetical protein